MDLGLLKKGLEGIMDRGKMSCQVYIKKELQKISLLA